MKIASYLAMTDMCDTRCVASFYVGQGQAQPLRNSNDDTAHPSLRGTKQSICIICVNHDNPVKTGQVLRHSARAEQVLRAIFIRHCESASQTIGGSLLKKFQQELQIFFKKLFADTN
jgi:hypothetical protein